MSLYHDLCQRVKDGSKFTFIRFGDGDWICLLGLQPGGQNCDKSPYYPDLGKHLALVVASEPPYIMGMQSMAMRLHGEDIRWWLTANHLEIPWVDADIFHNANSSERLKTLFDALTNRRVVLVGPPWLADVAGKHKWSFVEIPPAVAWKTYDDWRNKVYDAVKPNDVVLVCAGMPGKCLIDDLYWYTQGDVTIIDLGSALDYHGNMMTRRYHKVMWEQDGSKGELCALPE